MIAGVLLLKSKPEAEIEAKAAIKSSLFLVPVHTKSYTSTLNYAHTNYAYNWRETC